MEEAVPEEPTETLAEPAWLLSCMLVAVTVTAPADAGAVRTPVWLMEPALADQLTEGL